MVDSFSNNLLSNLFFDSFSNNWLSNLSLRERKISIEIRLLSRLVSSYFNFSSLFISLISNTIRKVIGIDLISIAMSFNDFLRLRIWVSISGSFGNIILIGLSLTFENLLRSWLHIVSFSVWFWLIIDGFCLIRSRLVVVSLSQRRLSVSVSLRSSVRLSLIRRSVSLRSWFNVVGFSLEWFSFRLELLRLINSFWLFINIGCLRWNVIDLSWWSSNGLVGISILSGLNIGKRSLIISCRGIITNSILIIIADLVELSSRIN